jgi:hypothetical protein
VIQRLSIVDDPFFGLISTRLTGRARVVSLSVSGQSQAAVPTFLVGILMDPENAVCGAWAVNDVGDANAATLTLSTAAARIAVPGGYLVSNGMIPLDLYLPQNYFLRILAGGLVDPVLLLLVDAASR